MRTGQTRLPLPRAPCGRAALPAGTRRTAPARRRRARRRGRSGGRAPATQPGCSRRRGAAPLHPPTPRCRYLGDAQRQRLPPPVPRLREPEPPRLRHGLAQSHAATSQQRAPVANDSFARLLRHAERRRAGFASGRPGARPQSGLSRQDREERPAGCGRPRGRRGEAARRAAFPAPTAPVGGRALQAASSLLPSSPAPPFPRWPPRRAAFPSRPNQRRGGGRGVAEDGGAAGQWERGGGGLSAAAAGG